MSIGLYIGRFQPFHLGHLSAVKQALKKVDFLHIGIGSAQYKKTEENPFSAEDRERCIRDSLIENGISEDQFKITAIPDIHDNSNWPAHVQNLVPHFDMLFVGDDGLVKKLFEGYTNIPVKIVKHEIDICATDIRKMMKENGDWEKWVPKSCIEKLSEL